jgi:tetratricopeptide (TPR) repeat protein
VRIANITVIAAIALAFVGQSVHAQSLVLKDNSRLTPEQFAVEGGKVMKKVKVGDNVATSALQMTTIARMDWPRPDELSAATDLMASGKVAEALAELDKAKAFFEPFKDIPGNWYPDIVLTRLEAMSNSEDFTATLKALADAQKLKLDDAQKLKLKIIKLNVDRQASSDHLSTIAQAENILSESTDSSVGASVWMIIGDVYAKKEEWEKALMAYLHVPVFYGTQVQKVPEAELQAARMLSKMRRFEDSTTYYARLEETYKGSGIGESAIKEKASINGLKNDEGGTDAPPTADKSKEGTAEAPAAQAAPAK